MKKAFLILLLMVSTITFGQNKKAKIEKRGDLYKVTMFHSNGEVAQRGFVTAKKELHGVWKSFDESGERKSVKYYLDGEKTGKWIIFGKNDKTFTEVNFENNINRLQNISQLTENMQLADADNDEE